MANTFINAIKIDQSTEILRKKSFSTTSEAVQSSEYSDVTRYVKSNLIEFTIECSLNSDNRDEKFTQLLELAEKKKLISVFQSQTYRNLIITDITELGRYINTISFSISFKQVNVVEFETIIEVKEEEVQVLQDESEEGLQQVDFQSINFEDIKGGLFQSSQ